MDKQKQIEALEKTMDAFDEFEMNLRIKRAQELVAEQIRAEYRLKGISSTWSDSNIEAAYREMAKTAEREKENNLDRAYRELAKAGR